MNPKSVNNLTRTYDYSISLVRLIAMSFIVICHFFQYYDNELAWWFNVGVEVFFCISGFLYGNKEINDPKDFIIKNFKKILVPYFCFLVPVIILYFLFAENDIGLISAAKAMLCIGTITGIEHLWFIRYILVCYVVTPWLYLIFQKLKRFKCATILCLFAGVFLIGQLLPSVLSKMACYVLGYFLAVILKEYGMKILSRLFYFCFAGCIISNAIRIYFKYFVGQTFFGFDILERYAHLLLGISIFLIVYIYARNVKPSKVFKVSDKYSYYVYIVHQLFILSPFSLMSITSNVLFNWALVIFIIGLCSLLLKYISDKGTSVIDRIAAY